MKHNFKLCVCIVIVTMYTSPIFSQKVPKITVKETKEIFNDQTVNTLAVDIYEASRDEIEKTLKSALKDRKAKVTVKKEIFGDDAIYKELGDNTVDVYAKIEKKEEGTHTLLIAVDLGGAYLSSNEHKEKYEAFKKYIYELAVGITKEAVAEQTKDASKILEKKEKEQATLVKNKEHLEKDIKEYESKIEQAKKDIVTNEKEQETKTKEIEAQREVVKQLEAKEKAIE